MLSLLLLAALAGPPAPQADCRSCGCVVASHACLWQAGEWACRPDPLREIHVPAKPLRTWEKLLPLFGQAIDAGTTLAVARKPPELIWEHRLDDGTWQRAYRVRRDFNPVVRFAGDHPVWFVAAKLGGGALLSWANGWQWPSRTHCWVSFGIGLGGTAITLKTSVSW